MRLGSFFAGTLTGFLLPRLVHGLNSDEIVLESFEEPSHDWFERNDPVMGGKSSGTFSIENGLGIFDGEVVDVPFLHVPGFIMVQSKDSHGAYPDISSCQALKITLKSNVNYNGYRVSFGNAHPREGRAFAFGYKANLGVPKTTDFVEVSIPLQEFSDLWDDATGDQIKTCKEFPKYCPDQKTLENMRTIAVWAEGVAGKVHLDIKEISATGCSIDIKKSE